MDYSSWSDEALLVGYASSSDSSLFDELIDRYQTELMLFLIGRVGKDLADDVFQDILLTLHLKCRLFDAGRRFRPWLFTVAGNKAIDRLRGEGRHQMLSIDKNLQYSQDRVFNGWNSDPVGAAVSGEESEWVRAKVNLLPSLYKQCITLHYFDGLGYREIAERLGAPLGTIKSRMNGGIKRLRRAG